MSMRMPLTRAAGLAAFVMVWLAVGLSPQPLQAQNQPFDLLIKNGHVIDARNGVDAVMDVAIPFIALFEVLRGPPER